MACRFRLAQRLGSQCGAGYRQVLDRLAATDLPIRGDVARQAGLLPMEHRDPFDRLLAAQAQADDRLLASSDPVFRGLPDLALLH